MGVPLHLERAGFPKGAQRIVVVGLCIRSRNRASQVAGTRVLVARIPIRDEPVLRVHHARFDPGARRATGAIAIRVILVRRRGYLVAGDVSRQALALFFQRMWRGNGRPGLA